MTDEEDEAAHLIDAQREYYDLRAPDYGDLTRPGDRRARGLMSSEQVRSILDQLRIGGDVLELACGTGAFTKELATRASSLTALDGSPTMLEINERTTGGAAANVDYVCADVFSWTPARKYDFVFFGFWLSHVPPTHLASFFATVRSCLKPGGRCGFVDEDDRAAHREASVSTGGVPTATRTLSDGRSFDIVKVFWPPDALEQQLRADGWAATVRPFGGAFLVGEALPPEAAVISFVDAINRGDLDALTELMTDDHALVVLDEAPLVGRDANREAWRGYFSSFPAYVIHPRHIASSGSTVAVLGTTTGSHLGLPDAEERELDVVWIAEVADGRISQWRVAEDTPELRDLAGIPRTA